MLVWWNLLGKRMRGGCGIVSQIAVHVSFEREWKVFEIGFQEKRVVPRQC